MTQNTFSLRAHDKSHSAELRIQGGKKCPDRFMSLALIKAGSHVQAIDIHVDEIEHSVLKNQGAELSCTWVDDMHHKARLTFTPDATGKYITLTLHQQTTSEDGMFETTYHSAMFTQDTLKNLVTRYKMVHPYTPIDTPEQLAQWDS